MSKKVVKKIFNLVENSQEFYKVFFSKEPKNIYIPEIYLSIKEFIYINEKYNKLNLSLSHEFTHAECIFIYYIGLNENINITTLAKITKSSKGYVSKVIKKLVDNEIVKTSQSSTNKKEIYVSLSKQGAKIYMDIYKHILSEKDEFENFLAENFNDDELKFIFDFFTKINKFKNEKYLSFQKNNHSL